MFGGIQGGKHMPCTSSPWQLMFSDKWCLGAVSRLSDRPRAGESIAIALVFALRARVRAKLRVREESAVARGGQTKLSGWSVRPARPATPLVQLAYIFASCYVHS